MPRAYPTYSPRMQSNTGRLSSQYSTPDTTNNSQSQQTNTFHNSQSTILSDVPQSVYSEYSTLDSSSAIPTMTQESIPHTPESLLPRDSPALDLDSSPGDDLTPSNHMRTDPNPFIQEQRLLPRTSPRTSSIQPPQNSSDSQALEYQNGLNNRELMNKNPAALALKVLNESISSENTDLVSLQQIQSEHLGREVSPSMIKEKTSQVSRNFDNSRMEQELSTSLIDTENRDINNEPRESITKLNGILKNPHHPDTHKSHEVNEMNDIEHVHEKTITKGNKSSTQPRKVSLPERSLVINNNNEVFNNF